MVSQVCIPTREHGNEGRAVSSFFDYIEGIIERRNSFTMQGFAESVDKFLTFNEYKVLDPRSHAPAWERSVWAVEI